MISLKAYLKAQGFGSAVALARQMGVNPQSVAKWKTKKVPAERVIAIWRATGLHPRHLRPDLYPQDLFK